MTPTVRAALLVLLNALLLVLLATLAASFPELSFGAVMSIVGWVVFVHKRRVVPREDILVAMVLVVACMLVGVSLFFVMFAAIYPMGAAFSDPFGAYPDLE